LLFLLFLQRAKEPIVYGRSFLVSEKSESDKAKASPWDVLYRTVDHPFLCVIQREREKERKSEGWTEAGQFFR